MNRFLFLCILLVFAPAGDAATVKKLPLVELANTSHLIISGTVLSVQSRAGAARQFVEQTIVISVEETHLGQERPRVTLVRLGGSVGAGDRRIVQYIPGQAQFVPGERVLVFLQEVSPGRLVVNGLGQGKFSLVSFPHAPGVVYAKRSLDGLNLVGGPSVVVTLAGMPDDVVVFPLSQVLDIIAGRRPAREPILLNLKDGLVQPPAAPFGSGERRVR